MRAAPLLGAGLLLLGFGIWLSLANGDGGAVPPSAQRAERVAAPEAPAEVEQDAVRERAANPPPPTASAPDTAAPPPRAVPQDAANNVTLHVRSLATRSDVAAFRWRFQANDVLLHGDGRNGHVALRLPPRVTGRLLVEAADCQPFVAEVTAPPDGAPPLPVDAFLSPAPQGAGITLLVRDTALRPIQHVRVDAFALLPGQPAGDWHLASPLWARRNTAADGRFVLPEMAPGEYGVRVLATDAEGQLLPLLPFRSTFVLTGSTGYVEEAVLEAGCLLTLELVDATGAPLAPAANGPIVLQLHPAGGAPVGRLWTGTNENGRAVAALDSLPARGSVAPAEPLPAGSYELLVSIDGQQRARQFVTLRAGERQTERILVP